MARGRESLERYKANRPQNNASLFSGPSGALYFKLPEGKVAQGRFLMEGDDLPVWCYVHEVPVMGRNWGDDVVCINQDEDGNESGEACPGCERELDRKFKGWTQLIWFAPDEKDSQGNYKYERAPLYARDNEGRFQKGNDKKKITIGFEPQVAIWSSGPNLFDTLMEKDEVFKGLRSRQVRIKRVESGGFAKYEVNPWDIDAGRQELSDIEVKLDEAKYDLTEFTKKPSYEDFMARLTGGAVGSSGNGSGSQQPSQPQGRVNPFMRNR